MISYYSAVLEYALDVVEVEGANAHEAEGLEKCHIHVLRLVVVNCFIMRVLPYHGHFALRH